MGANIGHFINYGIVGALDKMSFWSGNQSDSENVQGISHLTNYGTMGAIDCDKCETTITLNNLGTIGQFNSFNIKGKFMIENYTLKVSENAETFNKSTSSLSHLVISGNGVSFKDSDSKIILDFGSGFELETPYKITNLASRLSVDFSRLMPKNDIYVLSQSGQYFIAKLAPQYGVMRTLHKSNIRTMNNFLILSNAMIYPRKRNFVILREQSERRISNNNLVILSDSEESKKKQNIDSAFSLKSYESFAYQNESQNLQTRRIQRQNKRNYSRSRNPRNNNLVILIDSEESKKKQNRDSAKSTRERQNQRFSQNLAQNPHDYYFILTPFINHNYFFESGRYNLNGFDYGFLTAFSARVAESNSLGAHFAFSYGSLGDSHDKDLSITSMNFMLGLNYKLDLVYDMFFKARGDVFYFLNALDSATLTNIKPNNLGFGASVLFGKEWDFKSGGVLGIEAGLDYKALKSNKVSIDSQEYQQALYSLIYADVGLNYQKYFGGFGINLGGGFKANLAPNLAKSILLANSQNLDLVLDNDKYLGYANVGLSYVLNAKNFDMEFSLAYYGNFGDRIMSNGGGFEWRVLW